MKILIIDDNADDQALARRELEGIGHAVLAASNGIKGLELFRQERPDVVITDISVAGMDGFSLAEEIQALAAPRWQPLLFLSAQGDGALQARALQIGADAYVVKPVMATVVGPRLDVLQRLVGLQQMESQAGDCESRHRAEEAENGIARRMMQRLVRGIELDDPAVRHWIRPAADFSGAIVAAQRTPAGVIHILLADGNGTGLAASINALPVLAPFYRMTEKGYGVDAIARELNARIKDFLPGDRFVAVTLASIDLRERVIGVWNGGNPEPLLVGAQGYRTLARRHVPLGVRADDEFDDTLDMHGFTDGSQLYLYSDGLIEAENPEGEAFGVDRLVGELTNMPAAERFGAITAAVNRYVGTAPARDDISLLMVECRAPTEPMRLPAEAAYAFAPAKAGGGWRAALRLSAAQIMVIDVVPLLLGLADQFELVRHNTDRLFVVLSELYNNALDHGLLRLDSSLKLNPDGMEAYLNERQARLATLVDGEIELELEQMTGPGAGWLRVSCRDSGAGFDHGYLDPVADAMNALPFGRGLMLLRAMCAELGFNAAGNHVTATLQLTRGDETCPRRL
ncbi:MAG: fused response regulator/phosphatase [Gammaproteobacteria bacterium]|nr:fused response regulator/phosphatase [Gammaproteobacteria bacterium]MBU1646150.1 fused response regulator/phosphatase [Gammaproteobacteria bacterium]MBU1972212.1 fused response regulator/phosphatase [Gammaproteobacteria bacterium]